MLEKNGIPESPDKYEIKLADGLVIGEADKPYVDEFVKSMHSKNARPEDVNNALSEYFKMTENAKAREVEETRAFRMQTEEQLRQEWGPEFRANYNQTENFVKSRFPEPVAAAIMDAGPETIKAFAGIVREINPAMTVVPNSSNPNQAIADELKQLQALIGTPQWFADKGKQERFMQLTQAQENMRR